MQWYYASNGSQQGPVSEVDLKAKISSGEVKSTDLVWKDGMPDWVPASKVPEFQSASLGTAGAAPSVTPPSAPAEVSPYQTPNSPAAPRQAPPGAADIPTYMWQSIAATLLCCLPFGIVAIVYAAKVDGLKDSGDYEAARSASNSAKLWVNLSAGAILLLLALGMVANFLGLDSGAP